MYDVNLYRSDRTYRFSCVYLPLFETATPLLNRQSHCSIPSISRFIFFFTYSYIACAEWSWWFSYLVALTKLKSQRFFPTPPHPTPSKNENLLTHYIPLSKCLQLFLKIPFTRRREFNYLKLQVETSAGSQPGLVCNHVWQDKNSSGKLRRSTFLGQRVLAHFMWIPTS